MSAACDGSATRSAPDAQFARLLQVLFGDAVSAVLALDGVAPSALAFGWQAAPASEPTSALARPALPALPGFPARPSGGVGAPLAALHADGSVTIGDVPLALPPAARTCELGPTWHINRLASALTATLGLAAVGNAPHLATLAPAAVTLAVALYADSAPTAALHLAGALPASYRASLVAHFASRNAFQHVAPLLAADAVTLGRHLLPDTFVACCSAPSAPTREAALLALAGAVFPSGRTAPLEA